LYLLTSRYSFASCEGQTLFHAAKKEPTHAILGHGIKPQGEGIPKIRGPGQGFDNQVCRPIVLGMLPRGCVFTHCLKNVKHVWIMRCKRGRLLFFYTYSSRMRKILYIYNKICFYRSNDFTRFWANSKIHWTKIINELHSHFVIIYYYIFFKKSEFTGSLNKNY
jgi:hypothetical protein